LLDLTRQLSASPTTSSPPSGSSHTSHSSSKRRPRAGDRPYRSSSHALS
jgi:hypothetical protein